MAIRQRCALAAPRVETLEERCMLATWSGDIPNGTVWATGQVQQIVGNVHVPAGSTLTIQPGAIVKFNDFQNFSLNVDGTLLAQGTVGQPIYFTSLRDDSVGGDTNGNGAGTVPGAGQWNAITFSGTSTGSVLDHVEVRYGGESGVASVIVNGGPLTLTNSTLLSSSTAGIRIQNSNPTLTNILFKNNDIAASMDLNSNPAISGATMNNNNVNALRVDGGTMTNGGTWNDPGITYLVQDGITVPVGKTLTIAAGQVIKFREFGNFGITVNGTMTANGTTIAPIYFTTTRDDTVGGDTYNNGVGDSYGGQWDALIFTSTSLANVLDHVEVRYGGEASEGSVVTNGAPLTLTNSTLQNSATAGIRILNSNPTLTNILYKNNVIAARMDLNSNPAISGVTMLSNATNALRVDGGTMTNGGTWNDPEITYQIQDGIVIPVGKTLAIAAGQIVKFREFGNFGITVNGTLTASGTVGAPIYFTTSRDDSVGGDTFNNGLGDSYGGQWDALTFTSTSVSSVLDHVEVRYGGENGVGAVVADGGQLTLTNSTLLASSVSGIRIQNSNPVLTNIKFKDNFVAASMNLNSNPAISGVITMENNGTNALRVDGGTLTNGGVWNDPGITYLVQDAITVPVGKTLTVAAGQVVKFREFGNFGITVNGTLNASGTSGAPIYFTSTRDDSVGGDTYNNGQSDAYAGQWDALTFNSSSLANVLDHVEVRYAGENSAGAVIVNSAPLSVTNSRFLKNSQAAVHIHAGTPVLSNITFESNEIAARMDLDSNPAISGVTMISNNINALLVDGGTLTNGGAWNDPDIAYLIQNAVTVPAGKTLTISAGQVVKFREFGNFGITVDGTLIASGAAAAPIYFTSTRDDSVGGDIYNNGPSDAYGGQWDGLRFNSLSEGNILEYSEIRYAGESGVGALIVSGSDVAFTNGVVRNSSTHGIRANSQATMNIQNSLIVNNLDAGLQVEAGAIVTAINNTIDGNFRGAVVTGTGSVLVLTNNLITNNSRAGISASSRGIANATFNDVFNPGAADGNYNGLPNGTGANGNFAANPQYVNRAVLDFHLQSNSPAIDAATSVGAPIDDRDFNFRVDTLAVTNTGAGASPFFDLGAYEFGGKPRAVKHSPSGAVSNYVSQVVFTFRNAINPASFTIANDVLSFSGPGGPITVTGFQWLNPYQLALTFSTQAKVGTYQLVLGPNILDTNGNALDTDADGVRGEATDDRYTALWNIVPPRIVAQSPADYVANSVDHLDVSFDRSMDQQTFSLADVASFTGPGGNIPVTGFTWVDSRTLRLLFATQTTLGNYELVLSPNISDLGGNLLDQSGNLIGGEETLDNYSATFTLANILFVSGNITQNTTWGGLIIVEGDVTVKAGVTLNIAAGSIIKFNDATALTVETGATLHSNGTLSQPVRMTSIHDDTVGGDSDHNGNLIGPQAGDWSQIVNQGTATFDYTHLLYSSGVGNTGLNSGAIRNAGGTTTFSNGVVDQAFYDGIDAVNGTVTIINSVIRGADRGVVATLGGTTITIINSTFYDNRIATLAHAGGAIVMRNSIIANSLEAGFDTDSGPQMIINTDVFSTVPGSLNYRGMSSQTGTNGNISADPRFVDADSGNFRLNFGSPAIDAANGTFAPTTDQAGSPRYDDPRTANTGTITGNNAFADMGAFEFVEGAASNLDLIITTASGPTEALQGDEITVSWTTKNVGTAAAGGDWHDAIYLSTDPFWSPDDVFLGETLHAGGLGANQSYSGSADVTIPGLLPQDYYILVRANADNAVFEGQNLSNNTTASASKIALDVPALTVGVTKTGHLTDTGAAQIYKLVVPTGEDIILTLDGANGSVNELYALAGDVPTRQAFDVRSVVSGQSDQSLLLHDAEGVYYVMVYGTSAEGGEDFTLRASVASFSITSVSPTTASNTGKVTITIHGSQFDASSQPRLIDSAHQTILPTQVFLTDSGTISATFDLTGKALGAADVQVVNSGNVISTKLAALDIIAGQSGKLATSITAPARVRVGRDFVAYITYTNAGDTDLIAPIFRIVANGQTDLGLSPYRLGNAPSHILEMIGVNPNGPAGILPPGATGVIAVYAHTTIGGLETLSVETPQYPSTPIDYAALEAAMRPGDISNADWAELFAEIKSQIGTTWKDYSAALSRAATLMTPNLFGIHYSVPDVFAFVADQARAAVNTSVSGSVTLNDTTHQADGTSVILTNVDTGEVYTASTRTDGTFLFSHVDVAGTYAVSIDNYILETPQNITIGVSDITGLNLVAHPAGTISGSVLVAGTGAAVANQLVTAFAEDGSSHVTTSAADGTYTIDNLPPGTYTLQVGEGEYVLQTLVGVPVGFEEQLKHVNLALTVGGAIAGKITGPSGPLAGAIVTVYGPNGIAVGHGAPSSANGNYLITGIPAGQYTVQLTAAGLATARLTNVTINAASTLTNQNVTLVTGGSVSGTVLSQADSQPIFGTIVTIEQGNVAVGVTNSLEDGTFSLDGLAAGSYTLTVHLPGFVTKSVNVTITANQNNALSPIQLQTAGSISGLVTRAVGGAAVSGLFVSVWSGGAVVAQSVTDEGGSYTLADLGYGTYLVTVGANGQSVIASQTATVSAGAPSLDINFSVQIAGSIAGTVVGSDGVTPVAAALVTLRSGSNAIATAVTGDDGQYLFYVTGTGTYSVEASGLATSFIPLSNLVVSSGTNLTGKNLVAGTAIVRGTVRDAATGLPIIHASVLVSGPGINGVQALETDLDGKYQFAGPAGAQLQLVASSSTLGYVTSNTTLVANSPVTLDFSLTTGSVLSGAITAAGSGLPISGATVFLRNQLDTQLGFVVSTSALGQFSIPGLQPGTYVMIVTDGVHQASVLGSVVVTGATTQQNVTMAAATITVSGTVHDASGNLLPGTIIRAVNAQGDTIAQTESLQDGSFTFTTLPPGTYTLIAGAAGSGEVSLAPLTVSSGNQVTGLNFQMTAAAVNLDFVALQPTAPQFAFLGATSFESTPNTSFFRNPPKRLPDEVSLPPLPSGPVCVSVVVAHREAAERIKIREALYAAWEENYAAAKDVKTGNAIIIARQLLQLEVDVTKAYLSIAKLFLPTNYATISAGLGFTVFKYLSDGKKYLGYAGSILSTIISICKSGTLPTAALVATFAGAIKAARDNWDGLSAFYDAKKDTIAKGKDTFSLFTAVIDSVKGVLNIGSSIATTLKEADEFNGKTDFARDRYIQAAADSFIAVGNYKWQLEHCEESDPKVNGPDEVPLPPWAGGPVEGGSKTEVDKPSSADPNDKIGPAGYDNPVTAGVNEAYIQSGLMLYEVEFENSAAVGATVPAQIVVVTDTLDTDLDLTTLEFTGFGFGSHKFTIPAGLQHYSITLDLRPDGINLLVPVELGFDAETRVLSAVFQSLDPETGLPPDDPDAGFLPVNDANHIGEGFFTYTVHPKANLTTGTTIDNQASIVFDVNAAILTPTTHHTLDVGGPTSSVNALGSLSAASFLVNWSGTDDTNGSGIAAYDIYVSDNNGDYILWQSETSALSATYIGEPGHTYRFYSVAHDHVGNVEANSQSADATTTVETNTAPTIPANQTFNVLANAANGASVGTVAATDANVTVPNNTKSFSITAGNASGAFAINSSTGQITVANTTALAALSGQTPILEITVTDGGTPILSASQNVSVTVTSANTSPVLANPGPAPTFNGKLKTPVKIFPTLSVTDVDNSASIASIQISLPLGGKKKSLDTISFSGLSGVGTRADATVSGRQVITITVQQGVTNAAVQTLLQSMTFVTKGAGLKITPRNFQVRVTDRTGLQSNLITQNVTLVKK